MQRSFTGGPDLIIFSRETTGDTYSSAITEPAVLHDRAVLSDPGIQSVKPTMPSLAHASMDLSQPSIERENSHSPSVVEVTSPTPLEGRDERESIEESSVVVGQRSNPSNRSPLEQTTSNFISRTAPPSGQTWDQSMSPQTPLGPSPQHTTFPQHAQPLPSPSQRAIDTLHHIVWQSSAIFWVFCRYCRSSNQRRHATR